MSDFLRRIVVPLDFSETSDHALVTARDYAQRFGAEVDLVHVVPSTDYAIGVGTFIWTDEMKDAANRGARTEVEARASIFRDAHVPYQVTIVDGNAEDEIVRHVDDVHPGLVIMGTHGRTGFARLTMGSVAARVASRSSCPVMLVRHAGALSAAA